MGYIRHNAIVVTSWDEALIEAAACRARNIGLTVLGLSEKATNGYRTMLVCPDGSEEGWEESDQGDQRRETFRDWMNEQRYEGGSTSLHWAEIAYGSDDADATVEAHAWMTPNVQIEGRRAFAPSRSNAVLDGSPGTGRAKPKRRTPATPKTGRERCKSGHAGE